MSVLYDMSSLLSSLLRKYYFQTLNATTLYLIKNNNDYLLVDFQASA